MMIVITGMFSPKTMYTNILNTVGIANSVVQTKRPVCLPIYYDIANKEGCYGSDLQLKQFAVRKYHELEKIVVEKPIYELEKIVIEV